MGAAVNRAGASWRANCEQNGGVGEKNGRWWRRNKVGLVGYVLWEGVN